MLPREDDAGPEKGGVKKQHVQEEFCWFAGDRLDGSIFDHGGLRWLICNYHYSDYNRTASNRNKHSPVKYSRFGKQAAVRRHG